MDLKNNSWPKWAGWDSSQLSAPSPPLPRRLLSRLQRRSKVCWCRNKGYALHADGCTGTSWSKMTVGSQWSPESDAWIPAQKWRFSNGQGQSQTAWHEYPDVKCVCSHYAWLPFFVFFIPMAGYFIKDCTVCWQLICFHMIFKANIEFETWIFIWCIP